VGGVYLGLGECDRKMWEEEWVSNFRGVKVEEIDVMGGGWWKV
jgi:hypothetical protein